jgi:hypothetical protein
MGTFVRVRKIYWSDVEIMDYHLFRDSMYYIENIEGL